MNDLEGRLYPHAYHLVRFKEQGVIVGILQPDIGASKSGQVNRQPLASCALDALHHLFRHVRSLDVKRSILVDQINNSTGRKEQWYALLVL
ncbi:MAG: hypothetical protein R2867_45450 [Caldilineaceae bacterium]